MIKLDYTAMRSDGTTISQIRGIILREQDTIEKLDRDVAGCRENRDEFISRLSQTERDQLVKDQPRLFPNGLPTTNEVRFTGTNCETTQQQGQHATQ